MDETAETWRLTVALLEAADRLDVPPDVLALAHLGAAVVLFAAFDLATAERLAAAIENQATC